MLRFWVFIFTWLIFTVSTPLIAGGKNNDKSGEDQEGDKKDRQRTPESKSEGDLNGLSKSFRQPQKALHKSAPEMITQATPPRTQRVVHGPLCTLIMPTSVRIPGYLRVMAGDCVTLMHAENLPKDLVIARLSDQEAPLFRHLLQIDDHCANIYLEALDVLVEHPDLLQHIIAMEHPFLENIPRCMVDLLAARKQLSRALKVLFQIELDNAKAKRAETEVFRSQSPATILASAVFASSTDLTRFRGDFVNFAMRSIERHHKNKPETLCVVLKDCIDYLYVLDKDEIPPELSLVIHTLMQLTGRDSSLLGSMFFLRILCPAIVQPLSLCGISVKSIQTQKGLSQLTRALQLISNHCDPSTTDWLAPICNEMRILQSVCQNFVVGVAGICSPPQKIQKSLVVLAAQVYETILETGRLRCSNNERLQSALKQLEHRLGKTTGNRIQCEDDVPLIKEIRRIQESLQ